jgi:ABC-type nitrate/sulfonate/bicarbonate transport system permease component
MTAGVEQAELSQTASKTGSARVLRPALGLLLPVALAVFWEIAVRMGLSNGRLVPPPSVIWNTVMSVDRKIVEVGRVFRLSGPAMVRRILLPAVMPAYVISLRAGLGLGWMFVLAAEFLGASTGLGFLLIDGQQLGKPAQIVAAIVAFAILGKATDWLIVLVSSPFLRWEDRFART